MTEQLSLLYHWSPSERCQDIQRDGLQLHSRPVVHGDPGLSAPYVCLSPSPSMAWALSGDVEGMSEIEDWDLWMVRLPDTCDVRVRPFWGIQIEEVKVYTSIPASCLWYVGTRSHEVFKDVPLVVPVH